MTEHSTPPAEKAPAEADGSTIGEVAERTGLTVDTLRYYERIGLTPNVARTASGRRRYSEQDIAFLEFAQHMRATGMSLDALCRFVAAMRCGTQTVPERLAILEQHAAGIEARVAELRRSLDFLRLTISLYRAVDMREGRPAPLDPQLSTWSRLHLGAAASPRRHGPKRRP